MAIIPIYVFSNTLYSDFHELSIPADSRLVDCVRKAAFSQRLTDEEIFSPFCLFATKCGGNIIIGAKLRLKVLNELSGRFYRVARAGGKTETQSTVAFCLPQGSNPLLVNSNMLTVLFRKILSHSVWEAKNIGLPPKNLLLEADTIDLATLPDKIFQKSRCGTIDETIYNFYAALKKRWNSEQFEVVVALRENEQYKSISEQGCIVRIKNGEETSDAQIKG